MSRSVAGALAGLVLVFAAACGGGGGTATTAPSGAAQTPRVAVTPPPAANAECIDPVTTGQQITLTEHKFPAEITVATGETVTWVNEDNLNHTVSFRGSPDCGIMLIGESISVRFDGPGTYEYFCQFHRPAMVGKVIVE